MQDVPQLRLPVPRPYPSPLLLVDVVEVDADRARGEVVSVGGDVDDADGAFRGLGGGRLGEEREVVVL